MALAEATALNEGRDLSFKNSIANSFESYVRGVKTLVMTFTHDSDDFNNRYTYATSV